MLIGEGRTPFHRPVQVFASEGITKVAGRGGRVSSTIIGCSLDVSALGEGDEKGTAYAWQRRERQMKKMPPRAPTSPPQAETRAEYNDRLLKALVENLNRNVLAEHEQDLAMLPPEVRASKTPEQWLATPPLEILKLARDAEKSRP